MIVVRYNDPERFNTRVTCKHCGSELLYNDSDTKKRLEDNTRASINLRNHMDRSELEYVICPVCKHEIPLIRYWYTYEEFEDKLYLKQIHIDLTKNNETT